MVAVTKKQRLEGSKQEGVKQKSTSIKQVGRVDTSVCQTASSLGNAPRSDNQQGSHAQLLENQFPLRVGVNLPVSIRALCAKQPQ